MDEEERAGCFALHGFVFLSLISECVLWLLLAMQWVGLQCVIVVFHDHTHSLFVAC